MRTILVLLALGLAACGEARERAADPPQIGPLVIFEQRGGYASQPRRLVVAADGSARLTVTTGTAVTHRSFALSATDRTQLEQALSDARGVRARKPPGGCADCFEYLVRADGVDFDIDEFALQGAPEPMQRVVALLVRLSSP